MDVQPQTINNILVNLGDEVKASWVPSEMQQIGKDVSKYWDLFGWLNIPLKAKTSLKCHIWTFTSFGLNKDSGIRIGFYAGENAFPQCPYEGISLECHTWPHPIPSPHTLLMGGSGSYNWPCHILSSSTCLSAQNLLKVGNRLLWTLIIFLHYLK